MKPYPPWIWSARSVALTAISEAKSLAWAESRRDGRAGVLGGRGPLGQQARRVDLRRHLREVELDRLELADRLAELPPLLRVRERRLERAARDADREGGDRDPAAVEDLHGIRRSRRPRGRRASSAGTRQSSITSVQVSDARIPSLFSFLPTRMPGLSSSTTKAEIPWRPRVRSVTAMRTATSPTEALVMKFFEPFRTQESPSRTAVVFVPPESEPASASVRPQAASHSPDVRARQIPPLLRLGPEEEDVARSERGVRGERQRDGAVHARDLLDDRRVVVRRETGAAVLLRKDRPEKPELAQPPEHRRAGTAGSRPTPGRAGGSPPRRIPSAFEESSPDRRRPRSS